MFANAFRRFWTYPARWSQLAFALTCGLGFCLASAGEPTPGSRIREFRFTPIPAGKDTRTTMILLREIYRQAFLLAARDEAGCLVRDEVIGDPVGPDAWEVVLRFPTDRETQVRLVRRTPTGSEDKLWESKLELLEPAPIRNGPHVVAAEMASRGAFLAALNAAGVPAAKPAAGAAEVPAWLQAFADETELISSWLTVRKLHELRRAGESPAGLRQLARSYADLGWLCAHLWCSAGKAFTARSLLYAQRAKVLYPGAESQLAYAYALALGGMPAEALPEFAAVPQAEWPAWAARAAAFCRYDRAELAKSPQDPHAQLYAFCLAQRTDFEEQQVAVGETAVKVVPDGYRLVHELARIGDLGNEHRFTYESLRLLPAALKRRLPPAHVLEDKIGSKLARLPGDLPSGAAELADIFNEFKVAGAKDDKEPSWASLGRLLHEAAFIQLKDRFWFMRNSWGVETADYLQACRPLLQTHPFGEYILTTDVARTERTQALERLAVKLLAGDPEHRMQEMIRALPKSKNKSRLWEQARLNFDYTSDEVELGLSIWRRANMIAEMTAVDPRHPATPIYKMLYFQDTVSPQQIREWDRTFAADSRYAFRVARYWTKRDDAASIAIFERLIAEVPRAYDPYSQLADIYYRQDNFVAWRQTLEKYLLQPDTGLQHDRIRQRIAVELLKRGQNAEALEYAEAAAKCWAAWAMLMAAEANEANGRFDRAEHWVKQCAERYDGSRIDWLLFCHRLGRGDRAGADQLARQGLIPRDGEANTFSQARCTARYYRIQGDQEAECRFLRQCLGFVSRGKDMRRLIIASALFEGGKEDECKKELAVLIEAGKKARPAEETRIFSALAEEVQKWLDHPEAAGLAEVEQCLKRDYSYAADGYDALGRVLKKLGKTEPAQEAFLMVLCTEDSYSLISYCMAWRELRLAGLDVPAKRKEMLAKLAAREKAPPEAKPVEGRGDEVF